MTKLAFSGLSQTAPTSISSHSIVTTDQSLTGNNSFVDLATVGPTVIVTVNTLVLVIITCHIFNVTNQGYGVMAFTASGANTIAASTSKGLQFGESTAGFDNRASACYLFPGLTPGVTTFVAKYSQVGGPGTTHWTDRELIIIPLD